MATHEAAAPEPPPPQAAPLRSTRVGECNRLIEVINRLQEPLKTASGSNPDALRQLAEVLDHVDKRVRRVRLEDARLVRLRDDYATMAGELATASRETGAALEANDPVRAGESAKTMSTFGPRESELVDRINDHCGGRLDDAQAARAQAACDEGKASECHALAAHVREEDARRAAELQDRACQQGHMVACGDFGESLMNGEGGVTPDPARGVTLLERACGDGWASACGALGIALAGGMGVNKDEERGQALLAAACAVGEDEACRHLGTLLGHRQKASLEAGCERYGSYSACKALGREKY